MIEKYKKFLLFTTIGIFIFSGSINCFASTKNTYTLEEITNLVIQNNKNISDMEYSLGRKEKDLLKEEDLYKIAKGLGKDYAIRNEERYKISKGYTYTKLKDEYDIMQTQINLAKSKLQFSILKLCLNLNSLYEQKKVLEANEISLFQNNFVTEKKVELKMLTSKDLSSFDLQFRELENNNSVIENTINSILNSMRNLANIPQNERLYIGYEPEFEYKIYNIEKLKQDVLNNNLEYLQARHEYDEAIINADLAERNRLKMLVPEYNKLKEDGQKAEEQLQIAKTNIWNKIEDLYNDLVNKQKIYEIAKQSLEQNKLENIDLKYELGLISKTQYLKSKEQTQNLSYKEKSALNDVILADKKLNCYVEYGSVE